MERTFRDLSQQRVITLTPAVVAQAGVQPQPAFVPFSQTALFYIGKVDYVINGANRLTARFMRFGNEQPGNAGGGTSTIDTTYDYHDDMNSGAAQLVSTLGGTKLNELRVQYANRNTSRTPSPFSGNGQPIRITGVISFGTPFDIPAGFEQGILQVIDNVSWIRGSHAFKVGGDIQAVSDWRQTQEIFSGSYTFPTIVAYLAAKDGSKPYGYTSFAQTVGTPNYSFSSKLFSLFAQVSGATRMDPRFNSISVVQSNAWSTYRAITLSLSRQARGLQFNVNYSYGKGIDNAPAHGNLSFVSDSARSDPTNLDRDQGPNLLDSRHNFNGSIVAQPSIPLKNAFVNRLLNENQLGFMLQLNSGLPFTLTSNRDLNGDGNGSDRPLFVGRNSMYMPNRYNVDMRYSRYFPVHGNMRLEVIAEFKNVFNIVQLQSVNSTVPVDTAGNPLSMVPTDAWGFSSQSGFEQREFQLGFKFRF